MSLLVLLKLLCDATFYLSIASFFGDKYGTQPFQLLPLLLVLICWYASFLLQEKGLARFVPLLGLGLLVELLPSRADLILFAPIAVYCVVMAARELYGVAQDGYAPSFSIMSRILLFYLCFSIFFAGKDGLERVILPYVLVYLVSSVLLLRLSRLDEATLSQPRFQLMNLGYVAGALGLTLFCASSLFLSAARAAGGLALRYVVQPIAHAFSFVVGGGLLLLAKWLYAKFFSSLDLETQASQELIDFVNQPGVFEQFGSDVFLETPLWAKLLVAAFVLSVAVFCLYQVYRHLAAAGAVGHGGDTGAAEGAPRRRRDPEARSASGKVRQEYRRFLRLCKKSKLPLTPCQNSAQVEALAAPCFDREALAALRQVYLRARYGGASREEDVRQAREALRRLRASREAAPEEED